MVLTEGEKSIVEKSIVDWLHDMPMIFPDMCIYYLIQNFYGHSERDGLGQYI